MNAPEPRYDTALPLSGSRFTAVYRIAAESPAAAEEAARALVVEQTIEFPAELVGGTIAREVVARVESLEEIEPGVYTTELSFATELVGGELTQLLNVFFGNSSLLPSVRLLRIGLGPELARRFPGPVTGWPVCARFWAHPPARCSPPPSSRWGWGLRSWPRWPTGWLWAGCS